LSGIRPGDGGAERHITVGGKRVALSVVPLAYRDDGGGKPRLRFDKVAIRLTEQLQTKLDEAVRDGMMALVSVTAPIRLASKTAAAIEQKARALLAGRISQADEFDTIHGNQVRIRSVEVRRKVASRVIGFVHNPESDPRTLFDMTSALLQAFSDAQASRKSAGERWLVLRTGAPLSHLGAYRYIFCQLGMASAFQKILMVFADGPVETLA
jgi:hypothetical protein